MTTTRVGDPLVGRVLDGRYEIEARVARGGMATVYRAQDLRLTRTVAVKVMHDGLGDDTDFAKKFDREARSAARLSNPHVVSVFDQGVDLGRPYIVMEFIEGCTLRHIITREAPLEPLRVLDLMEPVVNALASAHDAGLVHRDVKPENVLISNQGQIKVGDFGLARAVTAQTATATQGLLIGTVSYLPPELVTAGRANKRSDVYSTGILLYELLTGKKPHTGDTPIQVAWSHVHNDVPAPSEQANADGRWRRDSRRIIPPYLDALVIACTRRQPALRPADGRELLALLRQARKALAHGIVDDPLLTERMLASTQIDTADMEPTAPAPADATADDEATTEQSAAAPAPPQPVSFRERSASSPVSSRTGRVDLSRQVRRDPDTSSRRARTPVSPVDMPHRVVWSHVPHESPSEPSTPVPPPRSQRSPRPLGTTAARPRPRSQSTPVFPQMLHDPVYKRRRSLVGLVMLLVFAVLGTGYGYWYLEHGRWTSAPAVTNVTQQQAELTASEGGFAIAFSEAYSETVPKGNVISSDPASGSRVVKGSTVRAVVSKGPERYAMPEVAGQRLDAARAAITSAHLKVGTVTEAWHEKVATGLVVDASQQAGARLKPNTPVNLVVSKGPKPITIPSVVGTSSDDATSTLTNLGFRVTTTEAHDEKVAKGNVISQTPAKGTGKAGDAISLVVSKGPPLVTVPRVTGADEATARRRLTAAGFSVKVVYNTQPVMRLDVVAMQTPEASGSAPKGSTVTIYVS